MIHQHRLMFESFRKSLEKANEVSVYSIAIPAISRFVLQVFDWIRVEMSQVEYLDIQKISVQKKF